MIHQRCHLLHNPPLGGTARRLRLVENWPPLRKSLYILTDLRKLMRAANDRNLAYLAVIYDPETGLKDLDKLASPRKVTIARSVASISSSNRTYSFSSPSGEVNGLSAALVPRTYGPNVIKL
jgi:hypothetical protein